MCQERSKYLFEGVKKDPNRAIMKINNIFCKVYRNTPIVD